MSPQLKSFFFHRHIYSLWLEQPLFLSFKGKPLFKSNPSENIQKSLRPCHWSPLLLPAKLSKQGLRRHCILMTCVVPAVVSHHGTVASAKVTTHRASFRVRVVRFGLGSRSLLSLAAGG
jgi:hypothetical protein